MAKKTRSPAGNEEEGRQLWNRVTSGIKAYSPSKPAPVKPSPARAEKVLKAKYFPELMQKKPLISIRPAKAGAGFDRSTAAKLKGGKLPIEGRLDLHGLTQEEAFKALHRFFRSAIANEKRTILVITGKGLRSEGVLKRMLPVWLEDAALKKHIVAVTHASPKDGGSGAFYIRLRKPGRACK